MPLLKAMTEVRILPGTPSLLSSVVERTTLDRVVVGSIPTGGIVLGPGRNIWNPNSLVSSVRQSIGLLRALYDAVNVIRGSRVRAPQEVYRLWSGRNNGIQLLTPLGLMGDEGPSRES